MQLRMGYYRGLLFSFERERLTGDQPFPFARFFSLSQIYFLFLNQHTQHPLSSPGIFWLLSFRWQPTGYSSPFLCIDLLRLASCQQQQGGVKQELQSLRRIGHAVLIMTASSTFV